MYRFRELYNLSTSWLKLNLFISIPYKGKNLIEFAVNITQRHYLLFTRFNYNE